jgi:hypothetical protein
MIVSDQGRDLRRIRRKQIIKDNDWFRFRSKEYRRNPVQPRSGARMQPTAQAVARRSREDLRPVGAIETLPQDAHRTCPHAHLQNLQTPNRGIQRPKRRKDPTPKRPCDDTKLTDTYPEKQTPPEPNQTTTSRPDNIDREPHPSTPANPHSATRTPPIPPPHSEPSAPESKRNKRA